MKAKEISFVQGIHKITILFKLFGLFPFSNKFFTIFYTFLSLTLGVAVLFSLFGVNSHFAENSYNHIVSFLVFIFRIIIPIISISHAFLTKAQLNRIFDMVNATDNDLIMILGNYRPFYRKHEQKVFTVVLCELILRTIFLANILINRDYNFFAYWMHCAHSIIVSRVRCIQTFFYADVINDRIMLIHQKLLQMQRRQRQTNRLKLYQEILSLRKIYSNLHQISLLANDCLGLSLFFSIISYAMDYVGNAWLVLYIVQKIQPTHALPSAVIGLLTLTIILLVMCHSCYRCEANVIYVLFLFFIASLQKETYHFRLVTPVISLVKSGTIHRTISLMKNFKNSFCKYIIKESFLQQIIFSR